MTDIPAAKQALPLAGRLLGVFGAGVLLGWYSFRFRRNYDVIVTDGEQVGIPYALLSRIFGRGATRHMMIVHVISPPKKAWLVKAARLAPLIDHYLVYCSTQRDFLTSELAVPAERITVSPFMVDTDFFDPTKVDATRRAMICSAGLERRDYETMLDAVEGLDVEVVIAAASPWSRRADSTARRSLPSNVTVCRLDLHSLRQLYAECALVVVPLQDVDFQAGITTILEAMAMARPVVVTRTSGQTDTIEEGVTGRYVPIGDAQALRSVLVELVDRTDEARWLGEAGRQWAVEHADIDRYAGRIAEAVDRLTSTTL